MTLVKFSRIRALVVMVVAGLPACGGDDGGGPHQVGACDGVVFDVADEGGAHVPIATPIEWSSNPPATGTHYPIWAGWDRHYPALDRGYYVHNAEHGGVVLLYNCPAGCPDVVASLLDVVRNATPDPSCTNSVKHRIIVAGDLLLPPEVQVAAVAWDTVYTASCFDPYLTTFLRARYRHGPEDTCADGDPMNGAQIMSPP